MKFATDKCMIVNTEKNTDKGNRELRYKNKLRRRTKHLN